MFATIDTAVTWVARIVVSAAVAAALLWLATTGFANTRPRHRPGRHRRRRWRQPAPQPRHAALPTTKDLSDAVATCQRAAWHLDDIQHPQAGDGGPVVVGWASVTNSNPGTSQLIDTPTASNTAGAPC